MKNMLFKSLVIVIAACAFSACKKGYLDTVPDNITTLKDIFTNRAMTEQWLARCYNNIPDLWDQPYNNTWSGQTDELDYAWVTPGINSGAITADNASPNTWNSYYQTIRYCAIFLKNADQNKEILDQPEGAQLLTQYKAEARFLRAYYYWLLMKQYGPVVLMGEEPKESSDNFQLPRSPWDECVAYVIAEMDKAYPDVPVVHLAPNTGAEDMSQTGRITKPVIAAVKSQVLLFHASPLFNGNTDMSDFKNKDGAQLFNQTYDKERWKRAADAAMDVIKMNRWELYKVADANPFTAAYLACRNVYFDGYLKEGIWLRTNTAYGTWERHVCPRSSNGNAWNGIAVPQEMVDRYRMADGSSITAGGNGYDENTYATAATTYYAAGTNNMYVNREPRFYVNVTFNCATIPVVAASGQSRVEFFYTGNSGKKGIARDFPTTGYTARKNVHPTTNFSSGKYVNRPAMMIRLAEIYLNYAEAMIEYGNITEGLTYLNLVRNRAGLPSLAGGTVEELRKQVRLERTIELMYEGHRYWDVRRWKVADDPESHQTGEFHGMNMEGGASLSDPVFHQRKVAFKRAEWQDKYYFYPVPQSEIDRNKVLVQSRGY